jgi:DNA-binding PadR family transcriptional regulator
LRNISAQVSPKILRELTKYFHNPNDSYSLDPSYEYTNSKDVEHEVKEPFANEVNVSIFKNLQKLESVGLIVPVGEEHMYYAAMNSKTCKLTSLGHHYWRLVREGRI